MVYVITCHLPQVEEVNKLTIEEVFASLGVKVLPKPDYIPSECCSGLLLVTEVAKLETSQWKERKKRADSSNSGLATCYCNRSPFGENPTRSCGWESLHRATELEVNEGRSKGKDTPGEKKGALKMESGNTEEIREASEGSGGPTNGELPLGR